MKSTLKIAAVGCAAVLALGAVPFSAYAAESESALPPSYSSKELGYTTSVKNQLGETCWIYSSLGTFESKLLKNGYEDVNLSVDHLNIWASTRDGNIGWIRGNTDSAFSYTATGYFTSWQGPVLVSDLPNSKAYTPDTLPTDAARFGAKEIRYLTKDDRETIKRMIYENGGVYTSYGNSSTLFSQSSTAYYMPENYRGSFSGHAIEVVGWDDNYPASNFKTTAPGDGAWLIKNSWGNNNSLGGYFWLSYYDKYAFAQKYKPSYAITEIEVLDGTHKLTQNEIFGATYQFDYIDSTDTLFCNRFDFDDEYSVIDEVMFETTAEGSAYTIYFIPDEDGAPAEDEALWTELASGTVDFSGYHCVDVDDFHTKGKSGSVAIRISGSNQATIGVGEWLINESGKSVFQNDSHYGESYVLRDGKMRDLMNYYAEENNDQIGGTFVIKSIMGKPEYENGDANMDGKVDISDVTYTQMHIAKLIEMTDEQMKYADTDGDGKVDITDATRIQMIIANII